ncbi:hypothetical protein SAMN05421545_3970 [Pontibacter lucknowensis]|uniref:Uncharacterized protein n=1 Tax=Pontibacter lucknowensis TaxID=1077936 RepID=A0A1N7BHE1_9BACT|nr:hypothetical protein SAMN05421545_3970 [Pontibacter lucknowensis]
MVHTEPSLSLQLFMYKPVSIKLKHEKVIPNNYPDHSDSY